MAVNIHALFHDERLTAAGKFDVQSIPQTHDDLLILGEARSDENTANAGLAVYFNNDTTDANYYRQIARVRASVYADGAAANTVFQVSGATAPANSFGVFRLHIPEYTNTSILKIGRMRNDYLYGNGTIQTTWHSIAWEDGGATAINRITIQSINDPTDEIIANSRLRIIGIKYS